MNPYKVGDWITYDTYPGRVISIKGDQLLIVLWRINRKQYVHYKDVDWRPKHENHNRA